MTEGQWDNIYVKGGTDLHPELWACPDCGVVSQGMGESGGEEDCPVCFLLGKLKWKMEDGRIVATV